MNLEKVESQTLQKIAVHKNNQLEELILAEDQDDEQIIACAELLIALEKQLRYLE